MIAHPRSVLPRSIRPWAPLLLAAVLASCGGETTPPEVGGTVRVTVTTTGDGPDADGYTVAVGSSEATVDASGSATFGDLPAGTYEVTLSGLAANCSVVGTETQAVTVAEGEEATVTFEVECPFDVGGATFEEVACSALSPGAVEGLPLDAIGIGGVPSGFGEPVRARMTWAGGGQVALGLIDGEGDDLTMVIPMHPSGSAEGGMVTVRIADEEQTCPAFDFEILPLPAADGEFEALTVVAQDLMDELAVLFGTTREELLGTPASELEPGLVLAQVAQAIVDGPANEYSLQAYLDGTAPDFEAEDRDVVQRLLALTGLREDLEAELAELQAPGAAVVAGPDGPQLALSPGLALDCLTALEMEAQLLHECMALARDKAQGAASEATQDKAIFALDVAAWAGKGTIAKPISTLISWSQLYDRILADNLPSSFQSLQLTLKPFEFKEDEPGPGTWAPANAFATSNGWSFEDIVTGAIVGALVPKILPQSKLTWSDKELGGWTYIEGLTELVGLETFYDDILSKVLEVLVGLGLSLTDDLLSVPPIEYGPVDISDTEWSDARIAEGTSVVLTPHEEYEPREPGTSILEVGTALTKFGGAFIDRRNLEITVGEIDVDITPSEVFLQPGQDTTFTVTVTGALHPDSVELQEPHPVQGTAELELGLVNVHTVTYTAPAEPTPGSTDLVAVHHIAEGGARGVSSEPRSASATIRFGGIRLLPVEECVAEGQEVQLEWELTGFPPGAMPELMWTFTDGDVSATGLFTAPETAGTVTITVALADMPNVRDSIDVPVGGCFCSFTVTVGSNPQYVGQPGDIAEYFAYETGDATSPWAIGYVNFETPETSSALFAVDIAETVVTGPGPYPVTEIGGTLGYGGVPYATYGDDGATLQIYEFEAHTAVTGAILGGTVHDTTDPDGPSMTISATFQIYPPPGTYYGVYSCTVATSGGQD